MITLNRKLNCIIFSRCDYLYRDGNRNDKDYRDMSDGDICIPLPNGMNIDTLSKRSDIQSLETIIKHLNLSVSKAL